MRERGRSFVRQRGFGQLLHIDQFWHLMRQSFRGSASAALVNGYQLSLFYIELLFLVYGPFVKAATAKRFTPGFFLEARPLERNDIFRLATIHRGRATVICQASFCACVR